MDSEKVRPVTNMEKPDEYTEWDKKSSSAPVEILTEFLTAIMLKDYETALKHCSQILTYEPKNSTAKEFYALILKKLEIVKSEELDSLSESDDSTYSASNRGSSQDTNNSKSSSSSSESNLSLEEADDEQSSELKTSPFESLNLSATQTERADVKRHVMLPSTSQNEENNLKTPSKKELHKPPYPRARALSTSRSIYPTTRTIKGDEKPKMDRKEFSPLKADPKKIANLSHLSRTVFSERRTRELPKKESLYHAPERSDHYYSKTSADKKYLRPVLTSKSNKVAEGKINNIL